MLTRTFSYSLSPHHDISILRRSIIDPTDDGINLGLRQASIWGHCPIHNLLFYPLRIFLNDTNLAKIRKLFAAMAIADSAILLNNRNDD